MGASWPPFRDQPGVQQQLLLTVKLCLSELPPTKVTSPSLLLLAVLTLVNIRGSSDKQKIPPLIDCPNIF